MALQEIAKRFPDEQKLKEYALSASEKEKEQSHPKRTMDDFIALSRCNQEVYSKSDLLALIIEQLKKYEEYLQKPNVISVL